MGEKGGERGGGEEGEDIRAADLRTGHADNVRGIGLADEESGAGIEVDFRAERVVQGGAVVVTLSRIEAVGGKLAGVPDGAADYGAFAILLLLLGGGPVEPRPGVGHVRDWLAGAAAADEEALGVARREILQVRGEVARGESGGVVVRGDSEGGGEVDEGEGEGEQRGEEVHFVS